MLWSVGCGIVPISLSYYYTWLFRQCNVVIGTNNVCHTRMVSNMLYTISHVVIMCYIPAFSAQGNCIIILCCIWTILLSVCNKQLLLSLRGYPCILALHVYSYLAISNVHRSVMNRLYSVKMTLSIFAAMATIVTCM